MVSRPKRINLDTDAVAALVHGGGEAAYVCERRRSGADILVSRTVVIQIGRAGREEQKRRLKAILRHCNGYTSVRASEMVAAELAQLEGRSGARDIVAVEPLECLKQLFLGPHPSGAVPFWAVRDHEPKGAKQALNDLAQLYRPHRSRIAGFREFVRENFAVVARRFVEWNGPYLKDYKAPGDVDAVERLGPRSAFMNAVLLLIGNLYRGALSMHKAGDGSLTDVMLIAECADADVLVTRDRELCECWQTVRSTYPDRLPDVVRVG